MGGSIGCRLVDITPNVRRRVVAGAGADDDEAAGGHDALRTENEEAAAGCCASGTEDEGGGGASRCAQVLSCAAWYAFLYPSRLFFPRDVTHAGGLHFDSTWMMTLFFRGFASGVRLESPRYLLSQATSLCPNLVLGESCSSDSLATRA